MSAISSPSPDGRSWKCMDSSGTCSKKRPWYPSRSAIPTTDWGCGWGYEPNAGFTPTRSGTTGSSRSRHLLGFGSCTLPKICGGSTRRINPEPWPSSSMYRWKVRSITRTVPVGNSPTPSGISYSILLTIRPITGGSWPPNSGEVGSIRW